MEAQECLERLTGSHSNFREFQRLVRNQTHNSRCCCPLPPYQTGPRNGRLRWFMDNHTSFNQTLKDLCLMLANSVLTKIYVECKELGCDIYHQHIGTAMGTSFSVVYAVIFMIHLESPIFEDPRFRSFIQLYKRFIDDIFLIWTGSAATLCEFRRALGSADDTIKLD